MKKQLIASLLAASAAFSQIGVFAAVPEDVTGTRFEEPMQILSALKIMIGDESGMFRPNDTIIRSEVAKMAVHAMGLENAAASAQGDTRFPDVGANHWANGYINVAVSQGLIEGDDNGNFRPNDSITYAEAMAIFVRATGYQPKAESKGGFPNGHILVGSDNGLDKNVEGSAHTPISRGNVAYIVSNSLTVPLMEQKGFGENATYEVTDNTLLEDKLGVTKASGQITAIEHTSLEGSSNLSAGQVKIGDQIFDTAYNINNLLGHNVTYYYKENDIGNDEIILAVEKKDSNATQLIKADLFEKITEKNDVKTIEYYKTENDTKLSSATLDKDAVLIYNGKQEAFSDTLVNLKDKAGTVKLLDTTKNGKYNIVFVTEYTNMVVEEVTSSGKIVDKYGKPSLKLDDDVDYRITKGANTIKVEDLKEYDVLSIAQSLDKKLYDIIVTNKVIDGKVSQIDEDGVYINGELYKIAANYTADISLGTEGKFYLDVEGKIAAADTDSSISSNYAYLIRAYAAVDADEKVTFKVFDKTGAERTIEAGEKIRFNGKSGIYAADVVAQLNNADGTTPKQLITFDVNSDGKIVKLNTAADKTATNEINENVFTKNYKLENAVYNASLKRLDNVKLDSNTVIFDISADTKDYAIADLSMFEDKAKYNVEIFDTTEDFTAKAVVVSNASFQTNAESPIAVVQKVADSVNDNDENLKLVTMLRDGKEISVYAEAEDIITKESGKLIKNGDIIQYKTNNKGEIVSVRVLLDIDAKETEKEEKPVENLGIIYGRVTKKFTDSINVTVNGGNVKNVQIPKDAVIYSVDSTKSKNNIETASFGDIQVFDEDEGNRIFIKFYKDVVQEVVIVK